MSRSWDVSLAAYNASAEANHILINRDPRDEPVAAVRVNLLRLEVIVSLSEFARRLCRLDAQVNDLLGKKIKNVRIDSS